MREHGETAFGELEQDEQEVRRWFSIPGLWIQVAGRDGRLVGYLDVLSEDKEHFDVDARPLDREAAETLVAAAEERARSIAVATPVLHGVVQGDDRLARAAYEAAGWELVRHSFQMRIGLDDDVPEPEWPDGLTVRNFRSGEDERVHAAQMDAFADHWDFRPQSLEQWRAFLLRQERFDPSLWWLAEDGDELAGLSLNNWHSSGDPRFGWVEILGVRPAWRRRGLGIALLRHSFRDFKRRGANRVGLGVDAENTTGAVRLYERAGMSVARQNDIYEKRLP